MKIATVQFRPEFKAKNDNLVRLTTLVAQAVANNANVVVLPELCTTGYSFMSEDDARPFAEVVDQTGLTFTLMSKLAQTYKTHIFWGMIELDQGTNQIYNSQIYVSPEGNWTKCQKVNLWGNDWLWAKPGRANPPIVKINGKKVGMLVCRDIRDKKDDQWKSFYEKGDADLVCMSANFGRGGFPSVSWMEFAQDNGCVLAVSNRYGYEAHNDFGEGGVCVIWPEGRVACDGLVWGQDCIVYADV